MTEWNDFNDAKKQDLTPQTLTNYFNGYERLRKLFGGKKNVANITQKDIVDAIESSEFHKPTILNIAIVIKQFKNKPVSKLLLYRNKLINEAKKDQPIKNANAIIDANTSYEQLKTALDEATGTDYLLFYILMNYNVRNADLIIQPILSKDKKAKFNTDDNFIILTRNKAKYVRQDYKTKSTYGTKEHIIEDKKFVKILKSVIEDGNEKLFINNMKKLVLSNGMSKYVKQRYNKYIPNSNLTQATIYKIILQHHEDNGDFKAMRLIADNRGHNPTTQTNEYSTINYNE